VEISTKNPLAKKVCLGIEGEQEVFVDVENEWIPPNCRKCHNFGHVDLQCHTKEARIPEEQANDPKGKEIEEQLYQENIVQNDGSGPGRDTNNSDGLNTARYSDTVSDNTTHSPWVY